MTNTRTGCFAAFAATFAHIGFMTARRTCFDLLFRFGALLGFFWERFSCSAFAGSSTGKAPRDFSGRAFHTSDISSDDIFDCIAGSTNEFDCSLDSTAIFNGCALQALLQFDHNIKKFVALLLEFLLGLAHFLIRPFVCAVVPYLQCKVGAKVGILSFRL